MNAQNPQPQAGRCVFGVFGVFGMGGVKTNGAGYGTGSCAGWNGWNC